MSRRRLLGLSAAALLTGCPGSSSQRVLVLGGTGWIEPHVVRALVGRGHRVTLFNRGRTDPERFQSWNSFAATATAVLRCSMGGLGKASDEREPTMLHAPEGRLRYWGELDTRRARDHGFAPRSIDDTLADAWAVVAGRSASPEPGGK